jgi:Hsp20/alpha crystallin family
MVVLCSYAPRTIRLPRDAGLSKIEAKYENGVLQLKIPKVGREAQRRTHRKSGAALDWKFGYLMCVVVSTLTQT